MTTGRSVGFASVSDSWVNANLTRLAELGVKVDGMRAQLGRSRSALGRLDATDVRRLWHAVAATCDDPLIGLRVGASLPTQATSVLGVLSGHSGSLREALQHLVRFQALVSENGVFGYVDHGTAGCTLTYRPRPSPIDMHELHIHSVVACLLRNLPLRPAIVELPLGRTADLAQAWERQLGSRAEPGPVGQARIRFSGPAMTDENPVLDAGLKEITIAYAERSLYRLNHRDRIVPDVLAAISTLTPQRARLSETARILGLSERGLQRRLAQESTSFARLRERQRMLLARDMIVDTRKRFSIIAQEVGYAEPSAFSHAVAAYWGMSPRLLRAGMPASSPGVTDRPAPRRTASHVASPHFSDASSQDPSSSRR